MKNNKLQFNNSIANRLDNEGKCHSLTTEEINRLNKLSPYIQEKVLDEYQNNIFKCFISWFSYWTIGQITLYGLTVLIYSLVLYYAMSICGISFNLTDFFHWLFKM